MNKKNKPLSFLIAGGLDRLVKYIRLVERLLGDGVKKVYNSEKSVM